MTKFEFQPFDKVLVRDHEGDEWSADFFSHYGESINSPYRVLGGVGWAQCVPYNETTKHLIGTVYPYNSPAKSFVFEFGDVVEVRFKAKRNTGIFITYSKRHKDFCVVAVELENGEIGMFTKLLKNVEFLRKGNFND